MIEVFQDGKLKARYDNIGGHFTTEDIVVLPSSIAMNCSMSAKSFDELFYVFLQSTNVTHEQAYNQAEQIHEQYLGKRRYLNFESFRIARDQRIKLMKSGKA